jgi:hypothetical protein
VQLPYDEIRGDRATRLYKPCAAWCRWIGTISRDEIRDEDLGGTVPAAERNEILAKVDAIHGRRPETPPIV